MSTALRKATQEELDAALEREIETAYRIAMRFAVSDPELSREGFKVMGMLIARRSPEQVARIERDRGLRA